MSMATPKHNRPGFLSMDLLCVVESAMWATVVNIRAR